MLGTLEEREQRVNEFVRQELEKGTTLSSLHEKLSEMVVATSEYKCYADQRSDLRQQLKDNDCDANFFMRPDNHTTIGNYCDHWPDLPSWSKARTTPLYKKLLVDFYFYNQQSQYGLTPECKAARKVSRIIHIEKKCEGLSQQIQKNQTKNKQYLIN